MNAKERIIFHTHGKKLNIWNALKCNPLLEGQELSVAHAQQQMGEIVPTTLNISSAIPQSQKHHRVRSYNLYSTNITFFAEKVEEK